MFSVFWPVHRRAPINCAPLPPKHTLKLEPETRKTRWKATTMNVLCRQNWEEGEGRGRRVREEEGERRGGGGEWHEESLWGPTKQEPNHIYAGRNQDNSYFWWGMIGQGHRGEVLSFALLCFLISEKVCSVNENPSICSVTACVFLGM